MKKLLITTATVLGVFASTAHATTTYINTVGYYQGSTLYSFNQCQAITDTSQSTADASHCEGLDPQVYFAHDNDLGIETGYYLGSNVEEVQANIAAMTTEPLPAPNPTQGPAGAQGERGEQGEQGIQGPVGPTGATGADGAPGRNGRDGIDGTNGINGQDGRDGVDGTNGRDGRDGDDFNGNARLTTAEDLIRQNESVARTERIRLGNKVQGARSAAHAYTSSLALGDGIGIGIASTGDQLGAAVSYQKSTRDGRATFNIGVSHDQYDTTYTAGFKLRF